MNLKGHQHSKSCFFFGKKEAFMITGSVNSTTSSQANRELATLISLNDVGIAEANRRIAVLKHESEGYASDVHGARELLRKGGD